MYFYPNECYVCETTNSLKQCSGCRMVSYCGEPHQKVDWKNHKTFCRAISTILKINHQSHIFEGLKGLSRHKWMDESKNMWTEIMLYLNRVLFPNEEEMLQFPRVCFVCFEARQNYLKNCPNCPFASFCKEHPSSPIHDRDCQEIKMVHDKKVLVVPSEERIQLNILVASLKKSEKPPLSMEDLMEQQFGGQTDIKENVKYYVSEAMSVPLTLYNAFQKLNQPLQSEIVVHVQGVANVHVFIQSWESILHLMPNIVSLTIVFIDSKQNSCTNVALCNKCLLAKKKLIVEVPTLPYVKYVKKKSCRKPNLLAMFMMDLYYCTRDQFRMWHENLNYWNTSSCPIVIAYKGNVERFVIENLHPYICNSSLYYMGLNSFSPLYPCLNPYDWTCCKNSMNIIIAKSPCESRTTAATGEMNLIDGATLEKYQEEDDVDDPDNSIEWKKRLWRRSFYHSVCYVCQAMNPTLACKKCKMIFYCGENHRRVHWPYHKMICRAILGMLNETGATSVFDQLPKDNDALWFKGKIDLLKRTELKIGKELTDGEREMFLFPKTCFICHANDSSILKNCKCGVSFCKIDMKNANHKEQCTDFSLVRKLTLILEPRVMNLDVKVLPKKSNSFPETMKDFIKNCLKFNHEDFSIPNLQTILLSDYLSRTLTFLYCAEFLMDPCYFENDSLVIHVIGATMREKHEAVFWKFVLYWFNHMKNLKVIFIGPEVETKVPNTQQSLLARFDFSSIAYMRYQNLETKSYAMKYEDYYVHNEFIEPEIIIGFNLNIHESEPDTWQKLAEVLTKIDCQFIMTAKSKARSFKDDTAMEEILFAIDYHAINYSNDINPYASFIPERDHEIEGLCYSNKCITFCTLLERRYRPSGKTLQQLEIEVEVRRLLIEKNIREKERAEKHAKQAAMRRAENSPAKKQKTDVKVSSVEIMPGLESNDEALLKTATKIKSALVDTLKKSEKSPTVGLKMEKLSDLVARLKKSTETETKIEESSEPGKSAPEMIPKLEELTKVKLKNEKTPEVAAKIKAVPDNSLNKAKNKKHEAQQEEKSDRIIRKALRRIVRIDGKEEKQETVLNGENYSSKGKECGKENFLKTAMKKETMSVELGKFGEMEVDEERKLAEGEGKLNTAEEENGKSDVREFKEGKEDEEEKLQEAQEEKGDFEERKLKEGKDEERNLKEDEEKSNKETDNKEKLKEDEGAKGNMAGKFNEAKEIEEEKLNEEKLKEEKLKEEKEAKGNKKGKFTKTKEIEEEKLKEDKEAKGNKKEKFIEAKEIEEEKLKEDKEPKGNKKGKFIEAKEIEEVKLKEDKEVKFKEETDSKEKLVEVEEGKIEEGKSDEEIIPLRKLKEDTKTTLKEETDGKEKLKEFKKGKMKEDKQERLNEKKENEEKKAKENKKEKLNEAKKMREELLKEKKEDEDEAKENKKYTLNEQLKTEAKKIEETKPEKPPSEEKGESSRNKNPSPSVNKKSKNKKHSKLENDTTIIEASEEIEKSEKISNDAKKAKNKKQTKNEREIPIAEELKEENLQISDNDSGTINKRGKNKKSKNEQNPKEKEVNLQDETVTKIESAKKSKNKKQCTKLEKDEKEEVDNKRESQETQESKETTKKGGEISSANENIEKKTKSKKQKLKNQTKFEMENASEENDNTLLVERNKLLEEHLFLMRENEKLKKENSKLRAEGERLRRENNEIFLNDCNDDLINKKTSL